MGYGAHLIRPRSTAIDPVTEPALMTPLRRPTRSLLPTRLNRWAKITLMIEFFGFVVNRNSVIVGTAWGYFYVFTVAWLFWPVSGAALWVCIAVSALLLALVAVAVWWRRSHIATVMPKSFRKSVYEYSWPNTAPERG